MNTVDILQNMQKLLSDPSHWTRGEYARDSNGRVVSASSSDAVCWCVEGAYHRLGPLHGLGWATWEALQQAVPKPGMQVTVYNDMSTTTHADIMKLIDRAIEIAQEPAHE